MPYNKELQKLKTLWYKKLKRSGFEDIENKHGDFKVTSYTRIAASKNNGVDYETLKVKRSAAEEYYRMAGMFLHDHTFEFSRERRIWSMHCEGVGVRDISRKLRVSKIIMGRSMISQVLKKLKTLMLARYRNQEDEQE